MTTKTQNLILFPCMAILAILIDCNVWLFMSQPRVVFDIDANELKAISTDSLHPDPALVWKDQNNIPHVSYNYSK